MKTIYEAHFVGITRDDMQLQDGIPQLPLPAGEGYGDWRIWWRQGTKQGQYHRPETTISHGYWDAGDPEPIPPMLQVQTGAATMDFILGHVVDLGEGAVGKTLRLTSVVAVKSQQPDGKALGNAWYAQGIDVDGHLDPIRTSVRWGNQLFQSSLPKWSNDVDDNTVVTDFVIPPYSRFITLMFRGRNEWKVDTTAFFFKSVRADLLDHLPPGPEPEPEPGPGPIDGDVGAKLDALFEIVAAMKEILARVPKYDDGIKLIELIKK